MNDYSSAYGTASVASSAASIIFSLAMIGLCLFAMWKLYVKAGLRGWEALIPLYNTYKLFEITWGKGLMFLLLLVPIANIVILCMTYYKLAKAFGHGIGYTLGLIFLNIPFICILAFSKDEYFGVPQ